MSRFSLSWLLILVLASAGLSACAGLAPVAQPAAAPTAPATLNVLAVETFLADIAQNVAGDRVKVAALMPIGLDPHAFEPTPQDVVKIAQSQALIVNGAGFEGWLDSVLQNAGGTRILIEAAAGMTMREPDSEETAHEQEEETHDQEEGFAEHLHHEGDPHFWLDPVLAIKYAENIRDGLIQADPAGTEIYAANTAAYITKLSELDAWIKTQVAEIPAERRLLVTNHESFGYFADRYGFTIVGTVIPSINTGASPSAQEMAQLVEHIKQAGAPAIFLETGANPQLAKQVGQEAGVKVVTELFTHSITETDGPAPTYLDMMKYNAKVIADALK